MFTSDRFRTIDPMRVLVTGGAGFIGSHVVDALVVGGHDVVVLDSLDPAAHGPERPDYLNPDARYVWGDVRCVDDWRTCLTGVEAVSHQAARVGLGSSAADVRAYVAANDEGTAAGLWAMHDTSFRGRLVLASSMVVYGEGAYRCAAHGGVRPSARTIEDLKAGRFEPPCPVCGGALTPEAVHEDAPLEPRSVYAATKLHQEQLCAAVGREAGWPVTALRYHNVYGPRMPRDTPYAGVASIFRSALAAGEAPAVYEDGAQRRDFVHVSDVAHANVCALTQVDPYCGALNIASGSPHSVADLAWALHRSVGEAPTPVVTGKWRLGDVRHVFASPARAATALGFQARVPFEAGITELATAPLRDATNAPSPRR